ncbi:hypothetical protein J2S98_004107 [Arthrobacter oryzae]|uniref:Uncharacterized protein n=1 Tax=Pseudarthrobacter enclensis TaxID=993070 RepID=A0ABT9RXQ2_9MICC|nr:MULTISPECIES: hypothetical protein [Micrococcaceae]MDP9890025.1 hypothetical protein [Pseudarthrobacter enclensis]MDP9988918.1 hypothetical protein [Arthrobacter oryzae]
MRRTALALPLLATAVLLTACAGSPTAHTTTTAAAPAPTSTAEAEANSAGDGHEHDEASEHYHGPNVTWDAAAEAKVKETAAKAMALFGRPAVEETTWFKDLEPMLATEYKEDARYIDPARVPFSTVTDGPAISREAQNPMTVTASFDTNAGPWTMMLHRIGQDDPWLVTSISPVTPQ